MSTSMRRAGIGALALLGLLGGHNAVRAQFSFGMTRYGMNNNNPYIAQQQAISNLGYGRLAIASGQQVPASLPYLAAGGAFAPSFGGFAPAMPYGGMPYGGGGYGANPYVGAGYGGYGANPYSAGYGGGNAGSNPYSATGASSPYDGSNTYSPYSGGGAASSMYGAFANPAVGPGYTLMGAADVMKAYGSVITSQEQARILREQYYQAKLDTRKKKFDLDMYIKNNTPTFTETQAKVAKQTLKRIQNSSNPAEVVDGRSLNLLLDDVDKYRSKTSLPDYDLPAEIFSHINIKPGSADSHSLGLLRDRGKLNWPSALVDMLPADVRKDIESRARALADNAGQGREADRNAVKDLRLQVEQARAQLLKKANYFDTRPYMEAKRFLDDLDNARESIERGNADAQIRFQDMVAKNKISNLNDLVKVMTENGWRFGRALPSDEGAYRALHSALAAYDVALNQQVAQSEP